MTATVSAPTTPPAELSSAVLSLAWGLGLATLLAPVVLFDRPYLQDFANHLSRVEISLALADPALAANYEALPLRPGNAAFDAVTMVLARWLGPLEAARVFLLVSMVLLATGPLALRRAFGLPLDIISVATLPFIYSASFAYGLLPYLLGVGIALHAMALWVNATRWPQPARLVFVPIVFLLTATHYYAVAIFAIFVVAEIVVRLDVLSARDQRATRVELSMLGLLFVPPTLWLLLSGNTGGPSGRFAVSWDILKPAWLLTYPLGFGPWFMSLAALAWWAAIFRQLSRRGRLIVDKRAMVAAGAMGGAFLVLPFRLGDLYVVDARIITAAVPVLLAGVRIDVPGTDRAIRATIGLLGLVAAMATALSWLWLPAAAARRDIVEITVAVPPGSRLFWSVPNQRTAEWVSSVNYGVYHAASHVAAERRLLVSTTFALSSQHPLRFRDPTLRRFGNISMVGAHDLDEKLGEDLATRLRDVILHFDYVLFFGPPSTDDASIWPLERLRRIAQRGDFRLYAVDRAAGLPAAR